MSTERQEHVLTIPHSGSVNYPTFTIEGSGEYTDCGVVSYPSRRLFTKVAALPRPGQYSQIGFTYFFNPVDAGQMVITSGISRQYEWNGATIYTQNTSGEYVALAGSEAAALGHCSDIEIGEQWAYTPDLHDPASWKWPIGTANEVHNALWRFTGSDIPEPYRHWTCLRIVRAAVRFGIARPGDIVLGVVARAEADMQLIFDGVSNQGDDLVIYMREGAAAGQVPVVRDKDGNFNCWARQCIYKKITATCEHALFAMEQYNSVISPSEKTKAEERLRLAQEQLEKARAIVSRLEEQVTFDRPALALGGERRIQLEEKG